MLNILSLLLLVSTAEAKPVDLADLCDRDPEPEQRLMFEDYEEGVFGLYVDEDVRFGKLRFTEAAQIFDIFGQSLAVGGEFEKPTNRQIKRTMKSAVKELGDPTMIEGTEAIWVTEQRFVWIDFGAGGMMHSCPQRSWLPVE